MSRKEYGLTTAAIITALVSLVVAWLSYSRSGQSLEQSGQALAQTLQLTQRQHDIDLLSRFADFHFASRESGRRTFALHIVDMMKDSGFRKGLRDRVFRDAMTRNFRSPAPVTRFDKDDDDWRVAGEALSNLRKDWQDEHERLSFGDWWCEEQKQALKRWPDHEQRLRELYRYLNDQHLEDKHFRTVAKNKLSKLVPCELAEK